MKKYSKIAFLATEPESTALLVQVVGNVKNLTDVYLVGKNPARLGRLRKCGLPVHVVETLSELPLDVFLWFSHQGFWAAVHKESGAIRDVGFATDSLGADTILLSAYQPDYRELFTVMPVEVSGLPGAPRRDSVRPEAE